MVRKTNAGRVWQNKKQNNHHEQNLPINQGSQEDNRLEQELKRQKSQQSMEIQQTNNSNIALPPKQPAQQGKYVETQKKKATKAHFKITSDLINLLYEKVYKQIVLPEFIQNSLNPQLQPSLNSPQRIDCQSQTPYFTVRNLQYQQITDFMFGPSLQLPSYFHPFKTNGSGSNRFSEKPRIQNNSQPTPWKKHKALSFFNTALIELSTIKFLNIYGPTGSGKTYTLNSIINSKKFTESVIWINGMNIINGKTKKFITDLKDKFDNIFWQFCNEQSAKESFSIEQFIASCFSKKNEKILILDQYDQINDFELSNLLKYAYVKAFTNQSIKKKQLFRISKPQSSFMQRQQRFYQSKLLPIKHHYMQHLIFEPFASKQVQNILLQKIRYVNLKFLSILDGSNQIKKNFGSEIIGIFQDQNLIHIIKKVSISQQIDIRKILQFYANSLKNRIESFEEMIQNPNQEVSQTKFDMKASQSLQSIQFFLVNNKFLENCQISNLNYQKPRFWCQKDSNHLFFYLSQIEHEGKTILKAIFETLKLKKRLLGIETNNNCERRNKQIVNKKLKANLSSMLEKSIQKTTRITDFFGKIRPKICFTNIYPWLYQWQELGLIKLKQGRLDRSFQAQVGINVTNKIKITDNFLIEVIDIKVISEVLDFSY